MKQKKVSLPKSATRRPRKLKANTWYFATMTLSQQKIGLSLLSEHSRPEMFLGYQDLLLLPTNIENNVTYSNGKKLRCSTISFFSDGVRLFQAISLSQVLGQQVLVMSRADTKERLISLRPVICRFEEMYSNR